MSDRVILTPYFLDQRLPGLDALEQEGWFVNHPPLPEGDPQKRMGILHERIAEVVARTVRAGDRPVSIAGDCCAAIGVAAGLQRVGIDADLVWLDAHGDFNTWETTPSGFLGGMPLAMIAGLGEQTMPQAVGLSPWPMERILLADGRDLDPGERELVSGSGIHHFMKPRQLLEIAGRRPLYLHFDTDLLNPEDAPAMNYPAPGGPRPGALAEIFSLLRDTRQIAAISMSTWNPDLDEGSRTEEICMDLFNRLLD